MTMKKTGNPEKATVVANVPAAPTPQAATAAPAPAPGTAPTPPPGSVEVVLAREDSVSAQLAQERILNAQLHLQNRQRELEGVLGQIKAKYEEGGRFALTAIDIPRGVITRHPV